MRKIESSDIYIQALEDYSASGSLIWLEAPAFLSPCIGHAIVVALKYSDAVGFSGISNIANW